MKLTCHFLSHNRNLLLIIVILFSVTVDATAKARRFIDTSLADTTFKDSIKRQVLLSQQLFVVKITPAKGKKAKKGIVDVKAELRDAFTVILYNKDTARIELEDAMCPDGKCPVGRMYDYGTAEYKHLDVLMADARRRLAESANATKRMMQRLKKAGR